MREALAVFGVGLLGLAMQGAIAAYLPRPYAPDLVLLVVLTLGIVGGSWVPGFLVAVTLGYATDFLSGALLGQHALLLLGVFALARGASLQLNLRGTLPLGFFTLVVSLVYGLGIVALIALFNDRVSGRAVFGWSLASDLGLHALANAVLAPVAAGLVNRAAVFAGQDRSARRTLSLEAAGGDARAARGRHA